MITLAEINAAYNNSTPEEKRELFNFLIKTPEFKLHIKQHAFDLMSPADFEMYKRIKGGFL